ncbi:hypothetical protein KC19_VG322100 [Ceratodon purpureus]|nr:hypothetical protein KC19_VG322100 [Ceratodon purpureus]
MQSRNHVVNWAEFAARVLVKRNQVRATKMVKKVEKNEVDFLQRSSVSEGKGEKRVTVLSKKRCTGEGGVVPPLINLQRISSCSFVGLKKEGVSVGMAKDGRRSGVTSGGVKWTAGDVSNMEAILELQKLLLSSMQVDSTSIVEEKKVLEGEMRRRKIMLFDRRVMEAESRHQLESLREEENTMQPSEGLANKVSLEEKTLHHHAAEVVASEVELSTLEGKLKECTSWHSAIVDRISFSEKMLCSYNEQLQCMSMGEVFPVPISENPRVPERVACILNACPMCGLWYKCYNYITAACGHTYYPWCIVEHSKSSCMVALCDESFTVEWVAAIGIRPKANTGAGEQRRNALMIPSKTLKIEAGINSEDIMSDELHSTANAASLTSAATGFNSVKSWKAPPNAKSEIESSSKSHTTQSAQMGYVNVFPITNENVSQTRPQEFLKPAPSMVDERHNLPESCAQCQKKPVGIRFQKCGHTVCCECSQASIAATYVERRLMVGSVSNLLLYLYWIH